MMWDVYSNLYGDYRWKNTFSWRDCETTADCNDGDLCNFDYGADGGFCEPCPGETDQACVDTGYHTDLGTDECKSVCVVEQSEFTMQNIFIE